MYTGIHALREVATLNQLSTQKNMFVSATHSTLGLEPDKIILKAIVVARTAERLSLRSHALQFVISCNVAFYWRAVRDARVAALCAE